MILRYVAQVIAGLFFILPFGLSAQEKCATVEYNKMLHPKASLEIENQFEGWMKEKLSEKNQKQPINNRLQSPSYVIPVVVHIIHNGESVGTGSNISDAQVLSQIQVINDDYKRLNADAIQTPAQFQSVAGSIDIQFVLAQQDPEGLATSGITRTTGTKSSWELADNSEFKALSYWPAEDYLNIWVVNLAGSYIGYAQLPVSGTLPGLENGSQDRLTDGVVIHYKDFGSGGSFDLDPAFNKGRTATHEIGHALGLRHIWGDASGCATDYVSDTPAQSSSTNGCPPHPQSSLCGGNKMFQNYMDYTDDACMNLFTVGQFDRVTVVLTSSPRRASLLTSHGANPPVTVANDLGIRSVIKPNTAICVNPFTPQLEVRNYGSNSINSAVVELTIDGVVSETKTFTGLSLTNLAITSLSFTPLNFSASSVQDLSFTITQINGVADGNADNNYSALTVSVPAVIPLPILEPFNALPAGWEIANPDELITWVNTIAPDNSSSNRAMYVNLSNYENFGSYDWLISPAFQIGTPLGSQLKFDLAYAQYPGESGDALKVYALPACSRDLTQAILLYDKSGSALATAPSTSGSFVPDSNADWRKSEIVSLASLGSTMPYQLAFISNNGYGNNIYVDNVIVSDQVVNDVAVTAIESPGLVTCIGNPAVKFSVMNFSTSIVTSFTVDRVLNGGSPVTQLFSGIALAAGEQKTFTLNAVTLADGINQISISVSSPNGLPDSSPSNNTISFPTQVDQSTDVSPLRLTFDSDNEVPWLVATPLSTTSWTTTLTNFGQSLLYPAYSNPSVSEESWLVSPVLDLSAQPTSSLFFDLSYGRRSPADERLRLVGSDDCGNSYHYVLLDKSGSQMSSLTSSGAWTPTLTSDWNRQYVNLDTLSGKKNVRLAFVITNENGNNLFLDNIEMFAGNDTQPPISSPPYQLYYSDKNSQSDLALTFNLTEKKDVRLQIYSVMGQIVADNLLADSLNQTYYFDLSAQASGIYLFRLQIDNEVSTTKVFIAH